MTSRSRVGSGRGCKRVGQPTTRRSALNTSSRTPPRNLTRATSRSEGHGDDSAAANGSGIQKIIASRGDDLTDDAGLAIEQLRCRNQAVVRERLWEVSLPKIRSPLGEPQCAEREQKLPLSSLWRARLQVRSQLGPSYRKALAAINAPTKEGQADDKPHSARPVRAHGILHRQRDRQAPAPL